MAWVSILLLRGPRGIPDNKMVECLHEYPEIVKMFQKYSQIGQSLKTSNDLWWFSKWFLRDTRSRNVKCTNQYQNYDWNMIAKHFIQAISGSVPTSFPAWAWERGWERATSITKFLQTSLFLGFSSRKIGQFQSTWVRTGKGLFFSLLFSFQFSGEMMTSVKNWVPAGSLISR